LQLVLASFVITPPGGSSAAVNPSLRSEMSTIEENNIVLS
jgi:hypothetical protein